MMGKQRPWKCLCSFQSYQIGTEAALAIILVIHGFRTSFDIADDNPAVVYYRKGLAITHFNLAKLLESQNRHSAAIAEFREAVRLDGDEVGEAIQLLANLLSRTGRHAEAIAALLELRPKSEMGVRSNPQHTAAHGELARLYIALGKVLTDTGDLPAARDLRRGADDPAEAGRRHSRVSHLS
jgi:tetratricopeptide (TPR) repeat protein